VLAFICKTVTFLALFSFIKYFVQEKVKAKLYKKKVKLFSLVPLQILENNKQRENRVVVL